uniref:Uncharacterized protein n=1 Tax=Candidatus Kentrum sp. FM TaxID=2126340 RepID=A0A450W6I2_9GAMM|nr:MAG: hypothetical protein BECKFM1743C_GA0114222_102405 [Candidatus Kentron sp. FM]VFJ61118.1 MAG: hypothetical protein BECKFM1743A_GA0114220_102791 [Candidatus Kentron sp. FM]VFK12654.1 MAG: hypothetical protein BECKFM1743B_GA0114221_102512 [Candidatus Kentron sp. FM]
MTTYTDKPDSVELVGNCSLPPFFLRSRSRESGNALAGTLCFYDLSQVAPRRNLTSTASLDNAGQ